MTEKRGDCCRLNCGKQHEVMFPGEHTGSNWGSRNPSEESVNLQPSVLSNFVFMTFLSGMNSFQENNAFFFQVLFLYAKIRSKTLNQPRDTHLLCLQ